MPAGVRSYLLPCNRFLNFDNNNFPNCILPFHRQIFLTITTTIKSMNSFMATILDILKAPSMQISIWRWEMHMIAKYGLDWGYKESWERF
ncbi:MAG: hypothetical protein NTV25_08865 [Methanothrix sp.]|nr:hypothetical protein [Methanothrix sp.]